MKVSQIIRITLAIPLQIIWIAGVIMLTPLALLGDLWCFVVVGQPHITFDLWETMSTDLIDWYKGL